MWIPRKSKQNYVVFFFLGLLLDLVSFSATIFSSKNFPFTRRTPGRTRARSRSPAPGRTAAGASPARTSSPDINANTSDSNHFRCSHVILKLIVLLVGTWVLELRIQYALGYLIVSMNCTVRTPFHYWFGKHSRLSLNCVKGRFVPTLL